MDLVAFFTYIINFSDLKLVCFMVYAHNIQGRWDGTRHDVTWHGRSRQCSQGMDPFDVYQHASCARSSKGKIVEIDKYSMDVEIAKYSAEIAKYGTEINNTAEPP